MSAHLCIGLLGIFLQMTFAQETGFHFEDNRILVPMEVADQPVRLVYDTGADFTVFFDQTAEKLRLETVITRDFQIGGQTVAMHKTKEVRVTLLGSTIETPLTIFPLSRPLPYDGIFTWRDLKPDLLIDGVDRKVEVAPKNLEGSWQKWAVEPDTRQLFFELTDGGQIMGRVFVDTGAHTGLRLSPSLWKQWREDHPDAGTTLETFQYLVGEVMVHEIAWAEEFKLGDLKLYDVDIGPIPNADEDRSIDNKGREYVAMIGIRAFRNLKMLVRPTTNELLTQSVPPILSHNRLGATFIPNPSDPEGLLSGVVLKGSPAQRSGLKSGDLLLEINQTSFRDWREPSANRPEDFFQRPAGTKLKITVDRNGEAKEITVILEDLLP